MVASLLALVLVIWSTQPVSTLTHRNDMVGVPLAPVTGPSSVPPLSNLAMRLQMERTAVVRDAVGQVASVFGLPVADARLLLIPVTRQRALPDGYEPPDLTYYGGRLVRTLVKPDLVAMVEAAGRDSVELAAISGYRSPDEQSLAFQSAVWRAMARERTEDGKPIDIAEAESRAARFVAPPGHSQHQLGTAIDFSSWEVNYSLTPRFAETQAGQWLEQHAWEYGFVLPYPRDGESRSGYGYEAWHYRWIGRELAAILHRDGYLSSSLIVDDYLRAVEELMAFEAVP